MLLNADTLPTLSVLPTTAGRLRLDFEVERVNGAALPRTRLTVREQRPPLQVVRAFAQADGAALVHLHNVSGGVLAGDVLEMEFRVRPHARVQLTSTSATRLYRKRESGQDTVQHFCAEVEAGGLIEYVPDPTIPFAGARMRQQTQITLAEDAGLFWWEMLAPGREARDERFVYDRLELKTAIYACGLPIAIEHALLQPGVYPLDSAAQLGIAGHYATFYACRVGADAAQLEAQLTELAQRLTQAGQAAWGVSALVAHGVAVRGLARNSRSLHAGLMAFWSAAKQALYGRAAIPPRKVN